MCFKTNISNLNISCPPPGELVKEKKEAECFA